MPRARRRRKRRKKNRHLLFILFFIAVGVFFYFGEFEKEVVPKKKPVLERPEIRSKTVIPELPPPSGLPQLAIILDDFGLSKQSAYEVFSMNNSITIAILPHRKYSAWIAEEANRRGHDIILHVPMEATKPLKLGEGGLYLWMTDGEIARTINSNINSVPFIKGVSNHMGSAFTQDSRAMNTVVAELKKHGLFFYDSITGSKSIAYKTAKSHGLQALKRDVFLDDKDDPVEIEKQWNKAVQLAIRKGRAIAQGHPRRNTLDVLKKALKNNEKVTIVPITTLIPNS